MAQLVNPVNSVDPTEHKLYGNTEPSRRGDVSEGVETEAGDHPLIDRPPSSSDAGGERGARGMGFVQREEIVRPTVKAVEAGRNDQPDVMDQDENPSRGNSKREGFARKTLVVKSLGRGETGRLRVRRKDVTSFYAAANPNIIASQVH